jgi:hypothetical protein
MIRPVCYGGNTHCWSDLISIPFVAVSPPMIDPTTLRFRSTIALVSLARAASSSYLSAIVVERC